MGVEPIRLLSDGTQVRDLIDLNTQEVLSRVYNDPSLHALEMDKIFTKSWLLLGHETEIPNKGDFMVRHMGQDGVIVARAGDNGIHVSLNSCPHRGMRVCLPEAGNSTVFRCIYHGWNFKLDGRFIGAPIPAEEMHGSMLPKSELGLRQARVALYGGLIFATWDLEGPSLDEFLGDIKFYLDTLFARTDAGIEVLGPPQRFMINANWKVASEQFACDGYHALTLHQSTRDLGLRGRVAQDDPRTLEGLYQVEVAASGHSLRCVHASAYYDQAPRPDTSLDPLEQLKAFPPVGVLPEQVADLPLHLSPGQLKLLAGNPPMVGGIFPNSGLAWLYRPKPGGGVTSVMCLHTFVPRGPGKFEFFNWFFAEKGTPEAMKDEMLRAGILYMGTTGMVETDDAETWPWVQQATAGPIAQQQTLKYHATAGENRPEGWPGGGAVYKGFTKDDTQWRFWLRWNELMSAQV